jgi:hypothetical protein
MLRTVVIITASVPAVGRRPLIVQPEFRMRRGVSSFTMLVGVLPIGLGLAPLSAGLGRNVRAPQVQVAAGTDLDAFSNAQLDRDLQDELDDVFEQHAPGDVADVATMQAELMEALSDDGDEGAETEITLADLDAEMREAGTSVTEVVHDALETLDQAARERPTVHLAVWRGAGDRGEKPSYGLAVRDTKRLLISEIRKAR